VEKSRAGAYFEFVLVSLRFVGVVVLVGSVYNPGRLNFGEFEAFLFRLSVLSLEYDHLIVLGYFNLDILINPGCLLLFIFMFRELCSMRNCILVLHF
jgi:hypothetical protein